MWALQGRIQVSWVNAYPDISIAFLGIHSTWYPICCLGDFPDDALRFHLVEFLLDFLRKCNWGVFLVGSTCGRYFWCPIPWVWFGVIWCTSGALLRIFVFAVLYRPSEFHFMFWPFWKAKTHRIQSNWPTSGPLCSGLISVTFNECEARARQIPASPTNYCAVGRCRLCDGSDFLTRKSKTRGHYYILMLCATTNLWGSFVMEVIN